MPRKRRPVGDNRDGDKTIGVHKRGKYEACEETGREEADRDRVYFQSYACADIHETMLRDRPRNHAYLQAIERFRPQMQGKVVIDVGSGTGILSVFCARAGGARKVYALEGSALASKTAEVVRVNGLADVIVVIPSTVEDADLGEEEGEPVKADFIVSEWMGTSLLCEGMWDSVVLARDRWLKPGGHMLPSHAAMYIAPFQDSAKWEERVGFWQEKHYDVDLSPMLPVAKDGLKAEPEVGWVNEEQLIAVASPIKLLDCRKDGKESQTVTSAPFRFSCLGDSSFHGFVVYFAVYFATEYIDFPHLVSVDQQGVSRLCNPVPARDSFEGQVWRGKETPRAVRLTTGPDGPETHWGHTVLWSGFEVDVRQDWAIEGEVRITASPKCRRSLDYDVTFMVEQSDLPRTTLCYTLE